jgi:hypothetical protein
MTYTITIDTAKLFMWIVILVAYYILSYLAFLFLVSVFGEAEYNHFEFLFVFIFGLFLIALSIIVIPIWIYSYFSQLIEDIDLIKKKLKIK